MATTPLPLPPPISAARRIEPASRGSRRAPARGRAVPIDDRSAPRDDDAALRTALERHVVECLRDAIEWRANSGIEDVWREDQDLYDGEDETLRQWRAMKTGENMPDGRDPVRPGLPGDQQSQILLNITEAKTDAAIARATEMLVPTNERPWEIAPTPIPDLGEAKDPAATIALADGVPAPTVLVSEIAKQQATERSEHMQTWIEDRFVEGSVYAELRSVIGDAGVKGTGAIKGPYPVARKKRRWVAGPDNRYDLRVDELTEPTSRRIEIENCYPAPDCGDDIHKGSYFVERELMTQRELQKLTLLDDYDREALQLALVQGPMTGHQLVRANGSEDRRRAGAVAYGRLRQYEVFHFYGWVGPDDLMQTAPFNQLADDDPRQLNDHERSQPYLPAIVTMVNGRAIRATLNPMETGGFPYDFFTWKPVKGQPWGRGVPRQMRVAQLIIIAAVRRLMENGGLASGPQIVATAGAIRPANGRNEITGRKLWWFTPKEGQTDASRAFAVFQVPMVQVELSAIIQFGLDMADRMTNLPLLMQGEQQAGTSPETFGGMKLLVANASSTLRMVAKTFDDKLIEPHLRRYNDWGMEHGPEEVHGDHDIKTKGSTELVQREEDSEFLMFLWGIRDTPELRLNPEKVAVALARTRRFPLETVQYTEDEWARKQAEAAQTPPPPDPAVQVANLRLEAVKTTEQARAESADKDRQFKAADGEADRQLKQLLAGVEKDIEVMRLSGTENISINEIKAMLASKAMDSRVASDEMALKLSPANPSGLGI